jgi:hypothetical protein
MTIQEELAKFESTLKERYVLVSKPVLTAILLTASLTTVGGAWAVTQEAIRSTFAKKALLPRTPALSRIISTLPRITDERNCPRSWTSGPLKVAIFRSFSLRVIILRT